jgi:hypothetical protein
MEIGSPTLWSRTLSMAEVHFKSRSYGADVSALPVSTARDANAANRRAATHQYCQAP